MGDHGNETLFDWIIFLISRLFFAVIRIPYSIYWSYQEKKTIPSSTNEILNLSAVEIARRIREKEVTSTEVVQTFIARIKEVNPLINAVIENNFSDALREAGEVDDALATMDDDERQKLEETKPLFGVPYTNKEHIGVAGRSIICGIPQWEREKRVSAGDAPVVVRMRGAGAIMLGRTNIPEGLMYAETVNPVYGLTRNPHDLRRTAGGSSGGESAGLAAQFAPIGIGSDAGGSIRIPAAFTGIFGLKPSQLAVSGQHVYPDMSAGPGRVNALTIGPMARHAEDLRLMYKILVEDSVRPELHLEEPVNLKKLRLHAVCPTFGCAESVSTDQRNAFDKAVSHLESVLNTAAVHVDPPLMYRVLDLWQNRMAIGHPDGDSIWAQMQGKTGTYSKAEPFSLWELVKWARGGSEHCLLGLISVANEQQEAARFTQERFKEARSALERLTREFSTALGKDGILVFPAWPTTAHFHYQSASAGANFVYTAIWNATGMPAVMVPMGKGADGLPTAVQIVADIHQERLLFAVAEELEKAFGGAVAIE